MGRALACSLIIACAGCAGSVEVAAVLADEAAGLLGSVTLLEVRAVDVEDATNVAVQWAPGVEQVVLPDLAEGTWVLTISGLDADGAVVIQGQTVPVEVRRARDVAVAVLLAPVEAVVDAPISGDAAESIMVRHGLSATTVGARGGVPAVLVAGGRVAGGASDQAWLYRPDRLAFEPVGPMLCPRVGHSAVAALSEGGAPVVVIAGGGDAPCREPVDGATAAEVIEVFQLPRERFSVLNAPGPARGLWPPDLSHAVLAPLSDNTVFLGAGGGAYRITVGQRPEVERLSDAYSLPSSGATAVTLTPEEGDAAGLVAVAGVNDGGDQSLVVLEGQSACWRDNPFPALAGSHTATPFGDGDLLAVRADRWWVVPGVTCERPSRVATGILSEYRADHTATGLDDGRVLLAGGLGLVSEGPLSFVLSAPRGTEPGGAVVIDGPVARHAGAGHAAALLRDGSVLFVGGGAPAELWNPDRSGGRTPVVTSGAFDVDGRVSDGRSLRTVFVVDGSEEASALRDDLDVTAADLLPRQWPIDATSQHLADRVGVLPDTGAASVFGGVDGCGGAFELPRWLRGGGESPEAPAMLDPTAERFVQDLAGRVRAAGGASACQVSQPLYVLNGIVDDLERGEGAYAEAIGAGAGGLQIVLVAAGDDCSGGPALPRVSASYDRAACHEVEGLLHPATVAERLRSHALAGLRIEVVVVHRFQPSGPEGACEVPRRLAAFVEALGDAGSLVSVCSGEVYEADNPVATRGRSLALRRTCAHGEWPGWQECAVAAELEWEHGADLLPLDPGEAWTAEPASPLCEEEGARGTLHTVSPGYSVPANRSFRRFLWFCW